MILPAARSPDTNAGYPQTSKTFSHQRRSPDALNVKESTLYILGRNIPLQAHRYALDVDMLPKFISWNLILNRTALRDGIMGTD